MFKFLQNTFGKFIGVDANPIGVDFGTDVLKMAQVAWEAGEPRLIAAASADVPGHVRHQPAARLAFFAETVRDLLSSGKFRGRKAIVALPAASMHIQHLRLPKMDDESLRKALPWEARGKLPIDPSHALLRHLVAGEVYHDSEPKLEVILMAAARDAVDQLLAAAEKARLDVVGMVVEPSAIVDCFAHVYRRKEDAEAVNCFVDIGCASSRAVIARGSRILFARSVKIGGEHFTRAVASQLKINVDEARALRFNLCREPDDCGGDEAFERAREKRVNRNAKFRGAGEAAEGGGVATMTAAMTEAAPSRVDPKDRRAAATDACREPLDLLAAELDLCRRYYEQTFPNMPVNRLVFVGGEARHRPVCHHVAREMSLAAQVGDPMVRMGHTTKVAPKVDWTADSPSPAGPSPSG